MMNDLRLSRNDMPEEGQMWESEAKTIKTLNYYVLAMKGNVESAREKKLTKQCNCETAGCSLCTRGRFSMRAHTSAGDLIE